MNKTKKSAILVLVLIGFSLILNLVSCSHPQSNSASDSNSVLSVEDVPVQLSVDVSLSADNQYYSADKIASGNIWNISAVSNNVYCVLEDQGMFSINLLSGKRDEPLYFTEEYILWMSGFGDRLYIITSAFHDNGEVMSLCMLDLNGHVNKKICLNDHADLEVLYTVSDMKVDNAGNAYLLLNDGIIVISAYGEVLGLLDTGSDIIEKISISNDGLLLVQTLSGTETKIRVFDTQGKCTHTFSGPDATLSDGFGEFWMCFFSDQGYYGFNRQTNQMIKLIDMESLNFDVNPVVLCQNDSYYAFTQGNLYQLNPLSEEPELKKLQLGVLTIGHGINLSAAIHDFEEQYPEFRVEIINYYEDSIQEQLDLQLLSGDGPDMIDFLGSNPEKYINANYVISMDNFLESDSALSREDILTADAISQNNSIYFLPMSFYLHTYYGDKGILGTQESITYKELGNIIKQQPDLLSYSKMDFLRASISSIIYEMIDYEACSCEFDSLTDVLEVASMLPDSVSEPSTLYQSVMIASIAGYQSYVENNPNMQLIGWPVLGDTPTVQANYTSKLAITSNCTDANAAWMFIKHTVCGFKPTIGIPVYAPFFSEDLEIALEPQKAYEGMEIIILDEEVDGQPAFSADGVVVIGDYNHLEPGISAENAENLIAMIDEIGKYDIYDDNIAAIVLEEAQAYFDGDKSAEAIIDIIEKRVMIYLSEQYG